MSDLSRRTVAVLTTTGFEDAEISRVKHAVEEAGGRVLIVAPEDSPVIGKRGTSYDPDMLSAEADAASFSALLLPGGVSNADRLRTDAAAVDLVRGMVAAGKPVAAICHGAWILTDADAVQGRTLTSSPSLRTDLVNAGADWVDEAVHVDAGEGAGKPLLITSRTKADLEPFIEAVIAHFGA
ncbi:type 1 glutamine amidotransferase domain-containing protein [Corynebacterium nuruki]|uniref:type 1 glutamine amidotransferase domain-containing protein n=1 Tax=Corynebacterium nuruki TaxID=1032851 RepID=UPI0039BFA534